jgi:GntR family transcriptional regulator
MEQFPVQVQRAFEQALIARDYSQGETLTVEQLSQRFRVDRDDLAVVISAEVRKGLVRRTGEDRVEVCGLAKPDVSSVFVHAEERGLRPTSEVRAVSPEPASDTVAKRLEVTVGAPIYRFERTRRVKGEPLANQINYMPFEVCPGLEEDDLSQVSFKKLLEEKYLVFLAGAEERIDLVPASMQDRQVLDLEPSSLVLEVDRLARSGSGWPVVWAILHIDPQRYEYVAELWPRAAELLRGQGRTG